MILLLPIMKQRASRCCAYNTQSCLNLLCELHEYQIYRTALREMLPGHAIGPPEMISSQLKAESDVLGLKGVAGSGPTEMRGL